MTFTVIIPAMNAEAVIARCVRAILAAHRPAMEILVVDDGSTDQTAARALEAGARVLTLPCQSGPAAARNFGVAHARGEVAVFIDADVLVHPDTTARLVTHLETDEHLAAVFGSYDDAPEHPGFFSQYRNLLHHYMHQRGKADASTFWAGCGAVRISAFRAVGGFDARRYPHSSIEDIELGVRLVEAGEKIRLDPTIQAQHLKAWSFAGLLKTDVFKRAVPWSRLIAERRTCPSDLNLNWSQRICGFVVVVAVLATLAGLGLESNWAWAVPPILAIVVVVGLNFDLYRFFLGKRGMGFAIRVLPFHLIYFLTSAVVFGLVVASSRLGVLPTSPTHEGPS